MPHQPDLTKSYTCIDSVSALRCSYANALHTG